MKIAIGADHAGFEYKTKIIQYLTGQGIEVKDFGTLSTDSVDFPDFAHPTANKHQGVRSALCWNTDIARLTRQHNNANIIALPARFVAYEYALEMIEMFLKTPFEGGRHERRVEKISC